MTVQRLRESAIFAITFALVLFFGGCDDAPPEAQVIADFEVRPSLVGTTTTLFEFEDKSTGEPNEWLWEFGDGTTSTLRNPKHSYGELGLVDVILTVKRGDKADEKTERIEILPSANVSFVPNVQQHITPGATVEFTDTSDGASAWRWNFGDGSSSTEQNPSHRYMTPGVFNVSLWITGVAGPDSLTRSDLVECSHCNDGVAPTADFSSNSTTANIGAVITFTDSSTPAPNRTITAWRWDFGDGLSSTARNPTHSYAACGSFTVTLRVTDSCGRQATRARSNLIIVSAGTKEMTISPTTWWIEYPAHTAGDDREFNGHGPDVVAYVELYTNPSATILYSRTYMWAKETVSNWTEGSTGQRTRILARAEEGYKFTSYPTTRVSDDYEDQDIGEEYVYGRWNNVNWVKLSTWGDTSGLDLCVSGSGCDSDDTRVKVSILSLTVIQTQICP